MQEKDNNQEVESQPVAGSFIEKFNEMPKTRKLAMVGFAIMMVCVMIFIVFFTGPSSTPNKPIERVADIKIPDEQQPVPLNQTTQNIYAQQEKNDIIIEKASTKLAELKPPTPPSLDKIEEPKPILQPLPAQQQVTQAQLPLPTATVSNGTKKKDDASTTVKQSSNIIAFGGIESSKSDGDGKKVEKKDNKDEFLGFDGGMIDNVNLKPTQAQSVIATKINNDLKYMIVQGKVIDAVLETAINTQMSSGVIRAVISRDIYGEQGDLVLIPKGSRLVGKYSASSSQESGSGSGGADKVMTRVYASWNRIITPSGVDLALPDTPAADPLGRNGIPGYLDTNLSNNLINAFLVSILGPYIVAEISGQGKQNINPGNTGNNNNNNNNNNNGLPVNLGTQVISQGIQDFQNIAKDQINKIYPPGVVTNFIDQGTRIDIIVQQDILFPKQAIQLNTNNLP